MCEKVWFATGCPASTQMRSASAASGLRCSWPAFTKPTDGGMRCFFITATDSRAMREALELAGIGPLTGRSSQVSATLIFPAAPAPATRPRQRRAVAPARRSVVRRMRSLQEAAQHPRGLLVDLQSQGQQVAGGLISRLLG